MNTRIQALIKALLLGAILASICWAGLLDLLPPVEKDSLIHHLALPKLWLKAGALIKLPWADYSYNPQNIDLLYMIPLALDLDVLAKFIHHGFAFLTACLIFLELRRKMDLHWALMGPALYLSTPMVLRLSASAYVDNGLTFFITAAVLALIHWDESGRTRWFIVSSLALGLALGCKYNGLLALPLLGLAVFSRLGRDQAGFFRAAGGAALYLGLAGLVFSPWAVSNFLDTGNPIFPLFNQVFGVPPSFYYESHQQNVFSIRSAFYGESFFEILLIPIRYFFQGQDFSARYFDGVLNPALFFLPLTAVPRPASRHVPAMGLFAVLWIVLATLTGPDTNIRYSAPVIGLLAIMSVYGLKNIRDFLKPAIGPRADLVLLAVLTAVLAHNAFWAAGYWKTMNPNDFLMGRQTRRDYLMTTQPYFAAYDFVNRETGPDAFVILIFGANRCYYLDRDYRHAGFYSGELLRPILDRARTGHDILKGFKELGATHIITRDRLLDRFINDNWPAEKAACWHDFEQNEWQKLFSANGYSVYRLGKGPQNSSRSSPPLRAFQDP